MLVAALAGFISTSAALPVSSGQIDLSSLRALKVASVCQISGQTRLKLKAFNPNVGNFTKVADSSISVEIRYIPAPTFPASAATEFTYGDNADLSYQDLVDEYICLKAAKILKIKTGQINSALEQRHAEVQDSFKGIPNNPSYYIMPYSSAFPQSTSGYNWYMIDNNTIGFAYSGGSSWF